MALRELPLVQTDKLNAPQSGNGRYGAAHERTRDAYRDVPILKKPTWKNDIAAYFYLGGISSGAFLLGMLADLAGGERRRRLARTAHYVAFATMVPCPILLIDDLGKPSRFHHMLRIFKPSSPMNLGAWALTGHGAFATLAAMRALAGEGKLPVVGDALALLPQETISAAGAPTALTLGGYTGVLLGTTSTPVWYKSPLLGALFMASAVNTGVSAVRLTSTVTGRDDPSEHEALAPFSLAAGVTELALVAGYLATSGRAAKPLLRGKEGAMMAGSLAATAAASALEGASLLELGPVRQLSTIAAAATLIGGALLRWATVFAGHTSAADREGTLDAMKGSSRAPGWGQQT